MKTVAFEFDGDTKYLCLPPGEYSDEQLEAEAARAIKNLGGDPDLIPWQIVDADTLPKDRTFRAALRVVEGKFTVDMDHARQIHMGRIRLIRNAALTALDVETMKAIGKGDNVSRDFIESQKQALRNIPQTIDLSKATTPDELKAIWPEELSK